MVKSKIYLYIPGSLLIWDKEKEEWGTRDAGWGATDHDASKAAVKNFKKNQI